MDYQQSWQGASTGAQSRLDFVRSVYIRRVDGFAVKLFVSLYNIFIALMNILGGRRR